ncbi:hypothetical protein [Streptosporangium sp. NPDC002524]|uniref:helix-turn-helix domain-containing protein n=1 Tax=Streptosporangium sp. NPDC002524 TaxID=3154537 RepID=UPI00332DA5A5
MRTPLAPGDHKVAAALYARGATLALVARQLRVSIPEARAAIVGQGVQIRPPGNQPRTFNLEVAKARYAAGWTLRELAAGTGLSASRVHILLRDAGVKMRDQRAKRAPRLTVARREAIVTAYKAGGSTAAVARDLQTCSATVSRVVKDARVQVRGGRRLDWARMRELRDLGWTYSAIGAELGTRGSYVWRVLNAGQEGAQAPVMADAT